ncbi:TetR/AcrR family transcriptional regulator [Tessaracoccus rhinocerotis]|uniref:TetR/AcrR family transcriptional regulator n=2 Tax=Tessaracoccus rhinocerotis TaxID=1689449 RepID=A0A553K046_9ACTN|nr:TetR/AcrR family transcriptional regulator [Tessaracoccus rhinocerotis]
MPMSETTPRRVATRQRLVEAAIREFAARGVDGTSVEQLCEAAGFTRGAFYSNFNTKDDLCVAVLEHHRDVVMSGLDQAFSDAPDAVSVEWATGTALSTFFAIIAPSEEFRITLMEIRLRALRSPELATRAEALATEIRPELVDFMGRIARQLGLRFRMPTEDLIDVFEALYFQGPADAERLIGPVAIALAEPA